MLQVISNDRYKAPEHRVLASRPGTERFSAPCIWGSLIWYFQAGT